MLTVAQAQQIVLERVLPSRAETLPLEFTCLGMVLAEDVAADLDSPPFTKSLMDGYAVRAADLASGRAVLTVIEEVLAGAWPARVVETGQATRIMTGAPLPQGADAVVVIERTRIDESGRVIIEDAPARPGQNVLERGREMKAGEVILQRGIEIRPQELGILAALGRSRALLQPRPRVAIVPTGDEIVSPDEKPGPGQIRNSNGPMLAGQIARAGGVPSFLGIARDTQESLDTLIRAGLEADVLVLSGGVSAGSRDLVPGALERQGAVAHFHRVAMKPGKPILFATKKNTLIFALPGNPVSSLVCFELFVRPALRRWQGFAQHVERPLEARLEHQHRQRSDRETYHPASLRIAADGPIVSLSKWFGSADLRALAGANALAVFPAGEKDYPAGSSCPVIPMESS